jgi:uncharacterized membrane protein YfcA
MLQIIAVLAISFGASIIGAVSGVGSGIIIKPILELSMAATLDIVQISLFSSAAVFTMALTAVVRQRSGMKDFEFRKGVPIAIGSIIGGIIGNIIFNNAGEILAVAQAILKIAVMGILLAHQIFESRITPLKLERIAAYVILGACLGIIAAFLGIGGGPLNLSALGFFLSMNLKTAALYSMFIILFAQGANLLNWGIFGGFPAVPVELLVIVLAGSVAGALVGASLYKKVNSAILKRLYSGVLLFVIVITAINLVMYI